MFFVLCIAAPAIEVTMATLDDHDSDGESSSSSIDPNMDPDECVLDLRACNKEWGGCGKKSYFRKVGCVNIKCVWPSLSCCQRFAALKLSGSLFVLQRLCFAVAVSPHKTHYRSIMPPVACTGGVIQELMPPVAQEA